MERVRKGKTGDEKERDRDSRRKNEGDFKHDVCERVKDLLRT
jgi:hypothetical protein